MSTNANAPTIDTRDLDFTPNNEGVPPTPKKPSLTDMTSDALWKLRESYADEIRGLSQDKGAIEQELHRRIREAHPDFTEESKGTVQIAGERYFFKLGWDRDYIDPADDVVQRVQASDLLTQAETEELIDWKPKVNGVAWNKLIKKGGEIAALIAPLRPVRQVRPKLEALERK